MAEGKNKGIKGDIFEKLRDYCPKIYVTRNEVQKLTGGYIKGSTLRQLDYEGRGITNRRLIGTTVVYDIEDLIEWLRNNTELINFDE